VTRASLRRQSARPLCAARTANAVVGWHGAAVCLWAKPSPLHDGYAWRRPLLGNGWATVVPLVFLALLITIGACIVAFFAWFVKHNCRE